MDETRVSCIHNNKGKIREIEKLTSSERCRNVTILLSINGTGDQFIHPIFVFPCVKIDNDLKKDTLLQSAFHEQKDTFHGGSQRRVFEMVTHFC